MVLAASPPLSTPRPPRSHRSIFSFLLALAQRVATLSMNNDALILPSESMSQSLDYNAPHNSLVYEAPTPIAQHTRSHITSENPWSILDTAMIL